MKSLILAAAISIGVAFTAGTADAQSRRSGVVYSYPTYRYTVPNSGYTNAVSVTPIVVTPVAYNGSYSVTPSSGNSYYGSPYVGSTQSTVYSGVTPSGVYYGGRRVNR